MRFNLASEILSQAGSASDRLAFAGMDGEVTHGELARRVERLSAALVRLFRNIPAGVPRIGVLCPTGVQHAVLMLAVMRTGACAVPVASESSLPERGQIRATAALHGVLSPVPAGWGRDAVAVEENVFWESFETTTPSFPVDALESLNPGFVRFSSGTTGASKGVVLSHETLRDRIQSANRRLGIGPEDRILWTLPMAHHFAVSILLYLWRGAAVVLPDGPLAPDSLSAARRHGATVFYGSPFQAALLASENSGRDWPTLRLAISTTAPLSPETARAFAARFGRPLAQGLGIIEAGLPLLNTTSSDPLVLGRADDFEIRIDGQNGVGELCLRGPGMFDAYLAPWCPRRDAMPDGWFRTGDLASLDAEGNVRFAGRLKTVINVGGSKCFPEEIESVLRAHEAISDARVFGIPHSRWGMLPVAEIVLKNPETAAPSSAELSKFCRARLASYKIPVRFTPVEDLPRTPTGKILRAGK